MASDSDDFDKIIENLKTTVRKSFARVYATLKARELKTLRQLDAIRKQCQGDKDLKRNCFLNIQICYEKESTIIENVNKYGEIDLERLNFDSNTFVLEDYISPEDDHMYSYKTIEELRDEKENLAIEEAALKQITATDNCVCNVNIRSEEVSKKYWEIEPNIFPIKTSNIEDKRDIKADSPQELIIDEEDKCDSPDSDRKKIHPTDDWLNSIKNQIETEPSQVTDVMEHSTITCS